MPPVAVEPKAVIRDQEHKHPSKAYLVELARVAATDENKRREGDALAAECPECYADYQQLLQLAKFAQGATAESPLSPREIDAGLTKLMKRINASRNPKSTE